MTLRLALLLAAAFPALASAQPPAATTTAPGAGRDDAAIAARLRARLLAGDTDHDGRLSRAEWLAMRAAMPARSGGRGEGRAFDPGRLFDRMDANGDGFLDSAEIDTVIQRRVARMDANGDGRVTRGERRGGTQRPGGMPAAAGTGAAQDGGQAD